jgi:ElaB/YqjD/DUF883 family membrane-anchored ribosome-binding protein
MSYQGKRQFFNDVPQKHIQNHDVVKKDKEADEKLKELTRCCICFENYSQSTRAPICVPCGHSFCKVCVQKLCFGNLTCCCICRKVSFFGPKKLGKNIQLLDLLGSLNLLDPDERPTYQPASTSFPENAMEGIEEKELAKFLEFCFSFIKKFYENKQENLVTSLAMVHEDSYQDIVEHANRMHFARKRLNETLDSVISRFNECCRTMESFSNERPRMITPIYGAVGYIPVFDDDNDPFGLESASIHAFISIGSNQERDFMDRVDGVGTSSPIEYNFPDYSSEYNNEEEYYNPANDEEFEEPAASGFRPGPWNPLSELFGLPRANDRRRNY